MKLTCLTTDALGEASCVLLPAIWGMLLLHLRGGEEKQWTFRTLLQIHCSICPTSDDTDFSSALMK